MLQSLNIVYWHFEWLEQWFLFGSCKQWGCTHHILLIPIPTNIFLQTIVPIYNCILSWPTTWTINLLVRFTMRLYHRLVMGHQEWSVIHMKEKKNRIFIPKPNSQTKSIERLLNNQHQTLATAQNTFFAKSQKIFKIFCKSNEKVPKSEALCKFTLKESTEFRLISW